MQIQARALQAAKPVQFGNSSPLAAELTQAIKDAGGPDVNVRYSPGSTPEQNKSGYPHLDNIPPRLSVTVKPDPKDRAKFNKLLKALDKFAPETKVNGESVRKFKDVQVIAYMPQPVQRFP